MDTCKLCYEKDSDTQSQRKYCNYRPVPLPLDFEGVQGRLLVEDRRCCDLDYRRSWCGHHGWMRCNSEAIDEAFPWALGNPQYRVAVVEPTVVYQARKIKQAILLPTSPR